MSSVSKLADRIEQGLVAAHPGLRKTVIKKLALAVGAMLEGQTPNTVELANLLPLNTARQDMREQWLRRLLKNPLVDSARLIEPFAREELAKAGRNRQTVLLSLDQTDLGERMAVLVVSVRVGDRALPLAWRVEVGSANSGFEGQRRVLDQVRSWLPVGAAVLLLADRFYPSVDLFTWLQTHGWRYRLRLKGNLVADPGHGDALTTGALAHGVDERYVPGVQLFAAGVSTNLGILHETGHPEPWIIAMDCPPTRAAVLDYGARWGIEPMFSDFKGRGFNLEDAQLEHADRLERLILIMTLAMYGCAAIGREDALTRPTALEKKSTLKSIPPIGASENSAAAWYPGSNGDSAD